MSKVAALNRAWLRKHPLPDPFATEDKEGRGRVMVVGGSARVPGAVLLAGKAALHAGAGKLHIATAKPVAQALAIALPEAMVSPLPVGARGEISGIPPMLAKDIADTDALLIGPGMSPSRTTEALVTRLLRNTHGVCVLDAGAISARGLSARPDGVSCIVTPHAGEMAAATGLDRDEVEAEPLRVARIFAREFGCIVAMKGVPTYIVSAEIALRFEIAAPGLGTSGSGDVLAGLIAGLLARGTEPFTAIAWGVWLHGQAGLALAKREGPVGYLARDISAMVPALLRSADHKVG